MAPSGEFEPEETAEAYDAGSEDALDEYEEYEGDEEGAYEQEAYGEYGEEAYEEYGEEAYDEPGETGAELEEMAEDYPRVAAPPPPPPPAPEPYVRYEYALPEESGETADGPGELAAPPGPAAPTSAESEAPPFVDQSLRFVHLFYGTNRARAAGCEGLTGAVRWDDAEGCRPDELYGGRQAAASAVADKGLEVGTVTVTFPPDHAVGKIERPFKVLSISLRDEDPERDVVISELDPHGAGYARWARELRATGRDQAFVYVHGFGNDFGDAARRAAQLAYDLDFDLADDFRGVPMFFSWPSAGEVDAAGYGYDYDTSDNSTGAFNRFLDLVKHDAGIRRVHVIAHSMGNRLVAEALYERSLRGAPADRIVDQLVLAAPDIWASRFQNELMRILPDFASRVTLYVSDSDKALRASSRLRKGEPRAGQLAGGILAASRGVERFDAIDASTLETDLLGHGYYASSGSALGDVYCLLKGTPAAHRPYLIVVRTILRFRSPEELAAVDAAACGAAIALDGRSPGGVTSTVLWLGLAVGLLLAAGLLVLVVRRLRRRSA